MQGTDGARSFTSLCHRRVTSWWFTKDSQQTHLRGSVCVFYPTGTFWRLKKTTKQKEKKTHLKKTNRSADFFYRLVIFCPQVSATEPFSRFLLFYPFRHFSITQFKHSCCPPTHAHIHTHTHTRCLLGAGQGQNSPPALTQSHSELNVHQKFRNKQTNK